MIKATMKRYSSELQVHEDQKEDNYGKANFDISPVLLYDVILMDC